jgi:hypothetical protein
MAESQPKLHAVVPADASDFSDLWIDTKSDGIVTAGFHTVPVGKPKGFFRVHPAPLYRRRTEIFVHKIEGQIEETNYIIAKSMRGLIDEAQPCTIVTCIYRDGTVRLWPIKFPKEGRPDNDAWVSSRSAAKSAMEEWVRLVWLGRTYEIRRALEGYAPDPDYDALPSFDELIRLGFGANGIIRDKNHPVYRELLGDRPSRRSGDGIDTDDDL